MSVPTAALDHVGDSLDYTPATAKTGGDVVVQNDLVGVTPDDIAANRKGAIGVEGVFKYPKATGAGTAFAVGDKAYWDVANTRATRTASGNKLIGTVVLAAATTDAVVYVKAMPGFGSEGPLFSQEAASAAISNTTVETAFDQSFTIPANTLKAGDVIRVRAQAIATLTNATDTLNLKLYVGAVEIAATGALDVANNDIGYFDVDIVIRTIGAGGTLVAAGETAIGASGTITTKAVFKASTAIDTTAALAVTVKATWSVANAGNSVRLDVLNAELIRK